MEVGALKYKYVVDLPESSSCGKILSKTGDEHRKAKNMGFMMRVVEGLPSEVKLTDLWKTIK